MEEPSLREERNALIYIQGDPAKLPIFFMKKSGMCLEITTVEEALLFMIIPILVLLNFSINSQKKLG